MFSDRDRLLKARLREPVLVTMLNGAAWSGVLYAVDDRTVVLRDAESVVVAGARQQQPVDGELLLARSSIDFMQRP